MLSHGRSQGRTVANGRNHVPVFIHKGKERRDRAEINPSRTAASLNLVVLSFVKDWIGRNTHDALLRQPNQLPTSAVPDLPSIW
jgi:hypothetical protein